MADKNTAFYRTIWRWHFYAGMFVIPFVLLLAVTGCIYIYKPQIDRWEERAFQNQPTIGAVSAQEQVGAALAHYPAMRLASYRLPEKTGAAAMINLMQPDGSASLDVFVSPQGEVLGSLNPKKRISELDKRLHGQLLLGPRGSWLVELAASWTIVLVLSGLYLWWPAGTGLAGVVWPRLKQGRPTFWRDVHAVTGFWISSLVLVTLASSLPWTGVWGSLFQNVRTEIGWVSASPQDWTLGGEPPVAVIDEHEGHGGAHDKAHDKNTQLSHAASGDMAHMAADLSKLDKIVAAANVENMAFPVLITPPGAPGRLGRPGVMEWKLRSDAQNRPLRRSITYDMQSGDEIARQDFADDHLADRVVGYGIAWHEGQLFGWFNQLLITLMAVGLIVMVVSGFVMWRRRRPQDGLGAPPASVVPARMGGAVVILLVLALLLPLLAASLVGLWLFDRLLLPHLPRLAGWLGLRRAQATA